MILLQKYQLGPNPAKLVQIICAFQEDNLIPRALLRTQTSLFCFPFSFCLVVVNGVLLFWFPTLTVRLLI